MKSDDAGEALNSKIYRLVSSGNKGAFESAVTRFASIGYIPQGGVAIERDKNGYLTYYQAMYREVAPRPEDDPDSQNFSEEKTYHFEETPNIALPSDSTVREWANDSGLEVAERGRVSTDLKMRYLSANP